MVYESDRSPRHAAPAPSNVRTQTVGQLKDRIKTEYQVLAELWAMDTTVYVVIDETVYRVFAFHPVEPDDREVTVVTYDPAANHWVEATRDAMTFGVELSLALTVAAIG